ncbi:MAG: hypothetical protein WDZ37_01915 [Solirubrobacterales bacterium]
MEPHTRRWVFWQFVVIAAAVNAVLSALIAWLLTLQQSSVEFAGVPLVDHTTVLVDSLSTLFVLPFLTTLIVTTIVRHEAQHGELVAPAGSIAIDHSGSLPRRALKMGAGCFAVLALPVVVVLLAAGAPDMTVGEFVLYKAIFGALYGLPVTPAVALTCLAASARPS